MRRVDEFIVRLVRLALDEDIGSGDLTSLGCLEPNPIKARIVAKSAGILSGLTPALLAFEIVDSANRVRPVLKGGDCFRPGDTIVEIDGLNQTVLTAERVALNFLAHLSGIATFTSEFVNRIKGSNCRILDTRKTTPGCRLLEKTAVQHGGGHNHRMGLYDMILIKDNHIAAAGSIKAAAAKAREYLKTVDFRLQFDSRADDIQIEIEVTTEAELEEAIEADADRLLLDNQSIQALKSLVEVARKLNPKIALEASGNVCLDNVTEVAATGVDFVSIGALTHSAPASDFSLEII